MRLPQAAWAASGADAEHTNGGSGTPRAGASASGVPAFALGGGDTGAGDGASVESQETDTQSFGKKLGFALKMEETTVAEGGGDKCVPACCSLES
jgi:hypothetical protein